MKNLFLKKILAGLALAATLVAPLSTAQAVTFPDGRATSGDLTISTSRTEDSVKSDITTLANSGATSVIVTSATGFVAGDYVFIMQMQGTGAGKYEINKIRSISSNTLNLFFATANTYQSTKAQVIRVNEYHNVTVTTGGTWGVNGWNGTTGGILVALINGALSINAGTISVAGLGYNGGGGGGHDCSGGARTSNAYQGEGENGIGAANTAAANGMGGGGIYRQGAGGGYASTGGNGDVAVGGNTGGQANLSTSFFFGGAGGGSDSNNCMSGGSGGGGGGIIFLPSISKSFTGGTIKSDGANGSIGSRFPSADGWDGAGGAGGAIYLPTKNALALGSGLVTSSGGTGIGAGTGSVGRVGTNAGATVTGTASPSIDATPTDTIINKDNEAQKAILGMGF